MATTVTTQNDIVQAPMSKIRTLSPEFAAVAEHIGRAMQEGYLKLLGAVEKVDVPSITAIYNDMINSTRVSGTADKFHHLRETLDRILGVLKPFAGVAFGVIVGLAGFSIGGSIGPVLVLAGFLFAACSAASFAWKQAHGAFAEE